ncbi:MAG: KOW domain-containing RNA-binding protein [Acutalibacteraceae bacterium]|nr:KOW domain-containing RNA-binding protein [Acutalibacteraceae bacterium]
MVGKVVYSAAGRDKGRFLVVVGANGDLPLVCDGKERPLERPKLKNPKHLRFTNILLEPQQYNSNKALRRALAALRGNVNEF